MFDGNIFDDENEGRLHPLLFEYMFIRPNAERVNYYGRMYTRTLVSEARDGGKDFELFMELYRRATIHHLKGRQRYDWDNSTEPGGRFNRNAVFVGDYDKKWHIIQRNGCTSI